MFKKPPQMYGYVHDKDLQPRIIEREKKSANDDKKPRIHSVKKTERTKLTEPNIPASKILHTNNNNIIATNENHKQNKSKNL
jgi:hypothetical protein